jgi:hypothetical protein
MNSRLASWLNPQAGALKQPLPSEKKVMCITMEAIFNDMKTI